MAKRRILFGVVLTLWLVASLRFKIYPKLMGYVAGVGLVDIVDVLSKEDFPFLDARNMESNKTAARNDFPPSDINSKERNMTATKDDVSPSYVYKKERNKTSSPMGDLPPFDQMRTHNRDPNPPLASRKKLTTPENDVPELFMDRLDRLLPGCPEREDATADDWKPCDYDGPRLFVDDVAKIERELLQFDIPRKVVVHFAKNAEYISLPCWRWHLSGPGGVLCPRCEIRHGTLGRFNITPDHELEPPHVQISPGCASAAKAEASRSYPEQIVVGNCGEAPSGSGGSYFRSGGGIDKVDYNAAFADPPRSGGVGAYPTPFRRTYAHLHFGPDKPPEGSFLFPLQSVTDMVRLLLLPPPPFPRNKALARQADASFSHNNCGHSRGNFVGQNMDANKNGRSNFTINAYGKCFHNAESYLKDELCAKYDRSVYNHYNCEGHRDATKTVISSWHPFTFAMENTLDTDYFTEKRYQVFLGSSVPILWNNHNSKAYMPDPDAGFLVHPVHDTKNAVEVGKRIHAIVQNETAYEEFFAWKKRGLRADFVRRLFLSSDFLYCRICEYVAHHHMKDDS